MPIGPNCTEFSSFEVCVDSITSDTATKEEAKKICGVWQNQCKGQSNMPATIAEVEQEVIEVVEGQDEILDLIRQEQPEIITPSGHVKEDCVNAVLQKSDPVRMTASFIIVTRQQQANLHNNKVQIVPSKLGQGLVLDLHKRAPVVLFEHGELPFPIGMSEIDGNHTVQLFEDKALAEVEFTQKIPDSVFIFGLVDDGILRMSSIGFLPDKVRKLSPGENRILPGADDKDSDVHVLSMPGGGMDIVEAFLLEWSITAIGADPGAFKQMVSRGTHHGEKVTSSLKQIFQKLSGPDTVWSPGMDMQPQPSLGAAPLGSQLKAHKEKLDAILDSKVINPIILGTPSPGEAFVTGHFPEVMNAQGKTTEGIEFLSKIGALTPEEQKAWEYSLSFTDADVQEIERVENIAPCKMTQRFDVDKEQLEASKLEYEWVSRYVSCQVKQLFNLTTHVPALYMGSYLTGLEKHLEEYFEEDVRQITYNGREVPPRYEAIQLSSTITDDFLVSGLRFMKEKIPEADDPICLVVKQQRTYFGIEVQIYCYKEKREVAQEIIYGAWEWCMKNNFLKGESFSLMGRFLKQGKERFEDVFLLEENKTPIIKAVDRLNEKGDEARNLGMIFMGPPGTGKTLSGRIIMNTVKATFIWISARDLSTFGAMSGFQYGFDLARDLSPAVLFIEDIDNFLYPAAIDLLKTEMDGISQSSGMITILTTNYPEKLPQAIIDRPGRFDDILKFDLPDDVVRRQMLSAWLGDSILDKELTEVVEKTEGYSGAHLRHLVNYAQELVDDSDGRDSIFQSVLLALAKIENQKELINKTHLHNQGIGDGYNFEFTLPSETPFADGVEVQTVPLPKGVNFDSIGQKLIAGVAQSQKKRLHEKVNAGNLIQSISNRLFQHLSSRGEDAKEDIATAVEGCISKASGKVT